MVSVCFCLQGKMAAGHVNAPHYVQDITVPKDPAVFPGSGTFPLLLGEAEQALYRRHYSVIRPHQQEYTPPWVSTYNFSIPPSDGAAANARHLEAYGYELNASVGAIMAYKVSSRLWYFHGSTDNHQLLSSPMSIQWLDELQNALQNLIDAWSWTNRVVTLIPEWAQCIIGITNVEYALCHDLAVPIQGPHDFVTDAMADDDAMRCCRTWSGATACASMAFQCQLQAASLRFSVPGLAWWPEGPPQRPCSLGLQGIPWVTTRSGPTLCACYVGPSLAWCASWMSTWKAVRI